MHTIKGTFPAKVGLALATGLLALHLAPPGGALPSASAQTANAAPIDFSHSHPRGQRGNECLYRFQPEHKDRYNKYCKYGQDPDPRKRLPVSPRGCQVKRYRHEGATVVDIDCYHYLPQHNPYFALLKRRVEQLVSARALGGQVRLAALTQEQGQAPPSTYEHTHAAPACEKGMDGLDDWHSPECGLDTPLESENWCVGYAKYFYNTTPPQWVAEYKCRHVGRQRPTAPRTRAELELQRDIGALVDAFVTAPERLRQFAFMAPVGSPAPAE